VTSDHQPATDQTSEDDLKWPIGFIVIVTLAGLYLALRFVQVGGWLIDWLF
jgi:hypothetical protein